MSVPVRFAFRSCVPRPGLRRVPRPRQQLRRQGQGRRPRIRSLGESSDGEKVDIDQLAKQLSNAAHRRRSRYQSPLTERPEDFDLDAFEVVQSLGYLSVKVSRAADDVDGEAPANNAAVIAYVGRYFSGKPYQYPVLTLLKEFLPAARKIAENEFRMLSLLAPIPCDKWEAASSDGEKTIPVVQLLGFFWGTARDDDDETERSLTRRGVWFVYKWEEMKPLSSYYGAEQAHRGIIWPWAKSQVKETKARHQMLRSILKGVVDAVAYCHRKGVVHGSLGSGSVLLSTFDDYSAETLFVKLENFGFASYIATGPEAGLVGSNPAVEEEWRSVGLLAMEVILLTLSEDVELARTAFNDRLVTEIFRDDFQGLKEYCMSEPRWESAVALLEERQGAGWHFLEGLLSGDGSHLRHRFLD